MKRIILIISLLLVILSTQAQLVNIEKKRKDKKDGFQGDISFALKLTQNTKQIIEGNNTINLQYTKKAHTILLLNDYSIMKLKEDGVDNEDDLINKNFQHIRYNYTIRDSSFLTFELFSQRQQNKLKYIDQRFLVGAGLRFRIIENDYFSLFIAPLIMYEYETLSDSLETETSMLKGDLYTSFIININDIFSFSHSTYYQPALWNFDNSSEFERFIDFRISTESAFTFSIIKNRLDFSIIFQMSYDSRPPIELIEKPLFYTMKNKLTFNF